MIEEILPPDAAGADTFEDLPDEPLFPAEEAAVAGAVDKRRREFRTVRGCARRALAHLGLPRPPLVPGPRGAPTWPDGVIGSMTHCDGYRAAVVARDVHLLSLGIDGEPDLPLPDGLLDTVALPAEREHLAGLGRAHPGVRWDRLAFSAKESLYKTWYPLTGRRLGFDGAALTVDPGGTFTAELTVEPPLVDGRALRRFRGRWMAGRGLVLTLVTVPRMR